MANNIVEIVAKFINEASAGLKKVTEDVDGLGEKEKETKKSSEGLGDGLEGLAGKLGLTLSVLGAVSAGFQFLKSTIDAYGESEVVAAQVNAVLQSTGGIAGVTAEEIDGLADSLSRMSGVDDEAIMRGEALMLTFTKVGRDVFPQATEAALNMSMAMGTDLQSSIIQVGKALNDPIEGASALRRVGVQLTDQQEEQIKAFMDVNDIASAQKIILNELAIEFGGVAEMMGDTTVGATNKLNVAWGNLMEAMGENTSSVWRATTESLTGVVDSMTEAQIASNKYTDQLIRAEEAERAMAEAAGMSILEYDKIFGHFNEFLPEFQRAEEYGLAWERALQQQADTAGTATYANETLAISMDAVKAGIQGVIGEASERYVSRMDTLTQQHDELLAKQQELIAQGWDPTSEKVQDVTDKLLDNEQAQLSAAEAMQESIDKMIFQQAAAGLDAEAQLELARAMGMIDEESYAVASATQALKKQFDDGKMSAEEYAKRVAEMRDRINELQNKNVTITMTNIQRFVTQNSRHEQGSGMTGGYAGGGIATGPESGHWELLHGTEAVIPLQNGHIPVQLGGSVGGGSNGNGSVMIAVNVSSPITIMDEQQVQNVLMPHIVEAIRQAQSQGSI